MPTALAQGDAGAAKRQRQRWIGALRQPQLRTGAGERGSEPQRANAIEQRHRRQVQRPAQRLGGGDRAGESTIEILRRVTTETPRQVVDARLRPDQSVLERHRIDKRFQRRARRAHRARKIEVGRPAGHQRADFATVDIGDQHRERGAFRQVLHPLDGEAFQRGLQRQIQRGADARRRGKCRNRLRGVTWQWHAPRRQRAAIGFQDTVAQHANAVRMAVWPQRLRPARDRDQQRRFGAAQQPRWHTEPGQ